MNLWKNTYPIIVSCAKGLAPLTAQEMKDLGYKLIEETENTVVTFGGIRDIFKLNLCLRTAHRVLAPVLRIDCLNLRELYDAAFSIDWENLLDADGYFTVNSVVHNDTVRDTRMPSLVTKDAIADRMRIHCGGARPDSGPANFGSAVFVYWEDRTAIFYLDTSGEPLSKRGYRKLPGPAPLQETLAAGCVIASGWNRNSPFLAPMCGSGTPAIEAALYALNRAPGSFKSHFAFMSLKGYTITLPGEKAGRFSRRRFGASPEEIWKSMVHEVREQERKTPMPRIIATDIDQEAVEISQINAIAAGVSEYIEFHTCDFAETPVPQPPGTIFLNPAYGARLGSADELVPLYQRIGDFFKQRCTGYTGCVLTGNMELSHKVGLHSKQRIPFFNGRIECRMMVYDLYAGCEKEKPDEPSPRLNPIREENPNDASENFAC